MQMRKASTRQIFALAALATSSCVPAMAGTQGMMPGSEVTMELGPHLPVRLASLPTDAVLSLEGEMVPGFVPVIPARPFVRLPDGDSRQAASDCLTAAVYHEARSEAEEGQRAVAQVVLNRVRHYAFPSTICGVVYQGSTRRTGCQFTFTCDGSLRGRRELNAWNNARRIAEEALAGYVHRPVGLATHYHTHAVNPYWAGSLQKVTVVGSHIFYRWTGAVGEPAAFVRRSASLERRGSGSL